MIKEKKHERKGRIDFQLTPNNNRNQLSEEVVGTYHSPIFAVYHLQKVEQNTKFVDHFFASELHSTEAIMMEGRIV